MALEQARCLLCGNEKSHRESDGGNEWVYKCPACSVYKVDEPFELFVSKPEEKVPDAFILSGYSRQLFDADETPPTYKASNNITDARRRQDRGEPAHPDLMKFVPETDRGKAMRILEVVKKWSAPLEFGEWVPLLPFEDFPICYAKSGREFHHLVMYLVDRGYVKHRGDMHGERLMMRDEGEVALTEWRKQHSVTSSEAKRVDEKNSRIFIGHGRSRVWKDLRDFLRDRLSLEWDEFNREPQAGKHTVDRLKEMLDHAGFAFIVMTAEDEHGDGKLHARQNVTHEAGLFQGRLTFERAIILLEEGCEEFSNIHGLTVIPFPKDDIESKFEEIRKVLEREGVLQK